MKKVKLTVWLPEHASRPHAEILESAAWTFSSLDHGDHTTVEEVIVCLVLPETFDPGLFKPIFGNSMHEMECALLHLKNTGSLSTVRIDIDECGLTVDVIKKCLPKLLETGILTVQRLLYCMHRFFE